MTAVTFLLDIDCFNTAPTPASPTVWETLAGRSVLVLSPAGAQVSALDAPDGLEIVRLTSTAVIGIARDAFGVESVRTHRLERAN